MAESQPDLKLTLDLIRSSTIKTRSEGLNALKHRFRHASNNDKIEDLDDEDFDLIFEALFKCAEIERSLYLKAGKRQLKDSAANRLTLCSSTLRVVVETCVQRIEIRLVRSLIDHIIESLPHPEDGHCEPLTDEYAKTLRLVLDDQIHVEHLKADKWTETLEFCLDAIDFHAHAMESSNGPTNMLQPSSLTQSATGLGSKSFGQPGSRVHASSNPAAEFVMCVRRLVQAPNACLASSCPAIFDSMLLYLRSSPNVGRGHHDAFATVNQVFSRTRCNHVEMTITYAELFLPLIREMWSSKRSSIRQELLTTLMLVEPHIECAIKRCEPLSLRQGVSRLSETLMKEFLKRQEKDLIYLDDLALQHTSARTADAETPSAYCMSIKRTRSETAWMTAHFIAKFMSLLDGTANSVSESFEMDVDTSGPNKRQRVTKLLDDFILQLSHASSSYRLGLLQVMPFLIKETSLAEYHMSDLMERLAAHLGDPNPLISSWVMLALTSCAWHAVARSEVLKPRWIQLWQVVPRNLSNSGTSRCASHLLDTLLAIGLLPLSSISQSIESMLRSVELDGPANVSEASLRLWTTLLSLQQKGATAGAGSMTETSLRWLFARWNPRQLSNKSKVSTDMAVLEPNHIVAFVAVCLGLPIPVSSRPLVTVLGPLSRACLDISRERDAVQYLLLLEAEYKSNSLASKGDTTFVPQPRHSDQIHNFLIDLLLTETENVLSSWIELVSERVQAATSDIVKHTLLFHLVVSRLMAIRELKALPRAEAVRKSNDEIARRVANLLGRPECSQDRIDAALTLICGVLPDPDLFHSVSASTFSEHGLVPLAFYVQESLREHRPINGNSLGESGTDSMDIDDDFDSQPARLTRQTQFVDCVRDDTGTATDVTTLRACVAAYLSLITMTVELATTEDQVHSIPPKFARHICSMDRHELYACRPLLDAIAQSKFRFDHQDAIAILEHVAVVFLQEYDFERCEPAILLCLELLGGFYAQWTQSDIDKERIGDQIFNWAMKNVLRPGIASTRVQIRFALVCYQLAQSQYPLARTTIFDLFGLGDCRVKFRTSSLIAEVLSRWKLTEHDEAFETLRKEHLPNDLTWLEQIAMRLEVVSRLAIRWPTLRRRCVYSIYETAAAVNAGSRSHATWCVRRIAESLSLQDSPTFFRLYAPQLLYTWLATDQLETAPYEIFGYATLEDLILNVEHEVVAQLVMRRKRAELDRLAASSSKSVTQLLQGSFPRACAYAMFWDMVHTPKDATEQNSETMLYTLLGSSAHLKLVEQHLHEILAIIMCTTSDVEQAPKAMARKKLYGSQGRRYDEMVNMCSSSLHLPAQQQPSFPVKYLIDLLERLCRRASLEAKDLWSAGRLTYCVRTLLEQMSPAYGSLHACTYIRKMRLTIALAGDVALTGYPLQMLIHALRPRITDQYCAADAIGILQYLFLEGKSSLCTSISFVAGSAVSILLSAKSFLSTAQDSTTQDTQFTNTKQQATEFHAWFDKYLKDFADGVQEPSHRDRFRSITRNAALSGSEGSAQTGTAEGRLLMDLLLDGQSRSPILERPSRFALIESLQHSFAKVPSSSDDIISSDEHAKAFASQLLVLLRRPRGNPRFRAWAARTIGRAFSTSNKAHSILRQSSLEARDSKRIQEALASVTTPIQKACMLSRVKILSILEDTLRSTRPDECAAAEEAIRSIIEHFANDVETSQCVELTLSTALQTALHIPERGSGKPIIAPKSVLEAGLPNSETPVDEWIAELSIAMVAPHFRDPLLGAASTFIRKIPRLAETLFPYLLHLALQVEFSGKRTTAAHLSQVIKSWFARESASAVTSNKVLLQGLLYLRKQPVPFEVTYNDRDKWLDLDYIQAARAATCCGWYNTGLQVAETHIPEILESSRRTSNVVMGTLPDDLMIKIYENLEDPDSFYGAPRADGLHAILDRLNFEHDGYRGLLFRGARIDSQIRRTGEVRHDDAHGMAQSLLDLNLNGLAHVTLSNMPTGEAGPDMTNSTLEVARKLQQWDVKLPGPSVEAPAVVYEALQAINSATTGERVREIIESSYLKIISNVTQPSSHSATTRAFIGLACLEEMDEMLSCTTLTSFESVCTVLSNRHQDIGYARYEHLSSIISSRQAIFGILTKNADLRKIVLALPKEIMALEIQNLLRSCATARKHGAVQDLLAAATYLHDLVPACRDIGININARANFEVARVLWQQGQQGDSIRMLQKIVTEKSLSSQAMAPDLPTIYGMIASHAAEARLEKPRDIVDNYFARAIDELHGNLSGSDAGEILHSFATFCDRQLHYSESREEFVRVERLRKQRLEEYELLRAQAKGSKDRAEKWRLTRNLDAMKRWVRLDEEEYRRLRSEREALIELSIENVLRSLQASDLHDDDVLRFLSLWFEFSDLNLANDAAKRLLADVPSFKFTPVMNQLSSRLQAEQSAFQDSLFSLVLQVCSSHPYHGMYQIFSGANPQGIRDDASKSRQEAALTLSQRFGNKKRSAQSWDVIREANTFYNTAAMARSKDEFETGEEYKLDDVPVTRDVVRKVPKLKVPPITLHIEARSDGDYSALPTIHHFKPTMKIAGGLSKPKIIIAVASDGRPYRQLLKGGSDDLRQDTIMEQVFEQVSSFLKRHPGTRQRDLLIRTYKVIPLSAVSGVIEFVSNTIPLNDVLLPMHEKYHPKDLRSGNVRKQIEVAKGESKEVRIRTFKDAIAKFRPAMRYWFLESFPDPDEWYERRLSYTRSTAASSILGYVMGLGDRHLHNILVDRKTGEVVHIDLGVAFEAGKVLPIPEIIPFRLTRDMVDGMGYSKTEGVFRRCCEFMLDTLREEVESILTVVNVLRYDPLCTWTVSPLKARKMQDEVDEDDPERLDEIVEQASKRRDDDAGEAARALAVVERKLAKTLSTAAMINELIQQATDDANLALLFAGWSAWV